MNDRTEEMLRAKDLDELLQEVFSGGGEPRYIVLGGEFIELIDKTVNPPSVSFKTLLKRKFPKQFKEPLMSNREVEISGEVRRETPKAYLWWDGKVEAWVPKSQISDLTEERDGSVSSIFIPEWLALEKGFL